MNLIINRNKSCQTLPCSPMKLCLYDFTFVYKSSRLSYFFVKGQKSCGIHFHERETFERTYACKWGEGLITLTKNHEVFDTLLILK